METILEKSVNFFLEKYNEQLKKFPSTEELRRYFNHKVKHTFAVSNTILDIMFNEKSIDEEYKIKNKQIIELAGLLHDISRFYQFDEKGKFIPNEIFRHGMKSVKIMEESGIIRNNILFFAISVHDLIAIDYENEIYKNLSSQEKKEADILAKLLRDADKFENMQNFIVNGYNFFGKFEYGSLSAMTKNSIENQGIVDRKYIKTSSDVIADVIFWLNDIYYEATKTKIKQISYLEEMLNQLKAQGGTPEDITFIKKYVDF